MSRFTQISENAFNELQTDAGVILKSFDPKKPELVESDIICATTGGVNISCVPTYSDWGEDIDNCPPNTMELKRIDGYECGLSFTALNITAETLIMTLGAVDIGDGKIVPRKKLIPDVDFYDLWWVGDRSDGGLVAVCLKNAISSGGFSLQTSKNGKGQLSVSLTGHQSIKDTDTVPMEFYVEEGTPAEDEE